MPRVTLAVGVISAAVIVTHYVYHAKTKTKDKRKTDQNKTKHNNSDFLNKIKDCHLDKGVFLMLSW